MSTADESAVESEVESALAAHQAALTLQPADEVACAALRAELLELVRKLSPVRRTPADGRHPCLSLFPRPALLCLSPACPVATILASRGRARRRVMRR